MLDTLLKYAPLIGPAVNAAGAWFGGESANSARALQSANQQDFQERMSNTAYQRSMADMKAAGLNPMLAFSQGGASVPVGSMAPVENVGSSAAAAFSSSLGAYASERSSIASAKQAESQADLVDASVLKIKQEIVNLKTENDKAAQLIVNLGQEYQNLVKQNWNLTDIGNHLRAMVDKLRAEIPLIRSNQFLVEANAILSAAATGKVLSEGKLLGFDIDAAEKLDNFGRELNQTKPLFDILRSIFRPR